jgi:hypothetical protein
MLFHPHIHVGESMTWVEVRAEWKQVRCEQCDYEYEYELIRRAKGEAFSPFNLLNDRARRAAERRADRKLERLLATGTDSAPCPECGWLQRDMVRELRRRSTSRLAILSWLVPCIFAMSGTALFAAVTARSSGPVLSEVRLTITALLAAAAISGAMLMAITSHARRRIDPNQDFPSAAPAIPATPRIRSSQRNPVNFIATCIEPGVWITVQLQGLRFPHVCCRCLAPTAELHSMATMRQVRVPVRLCSHCNRAAQRHLGTLALLMTLLGIACAVPGLWIDVEPIVRWAVFPCVGGAAGYIWGTRCELVSESRHDGQIRLGSKHAAIEIP